MVDLNPRGGLQVSEQTYPHGRVLYIFAEAPVVRLPRVSRSPEALALAQQIVGEYSDIVKLRRAIKDALKCFTDCLQLSEYVELTACFTALKEMAGRRARFQIENENSAMSPMLTADGVAWENLEHHTVMHLQSARAHFQSVLTNSFVFRGIKQEKVSRITSKLQELYQPRYQAQAQGARDMYTILKRIPEYIEGFMEEIDRFLEDVELAKPYLEDRPNTGLICIAEQ